METCQSTVFGQPATDPLIDWVGNVRVGDVQGSDCPGG